MERTARYMQRGAGLMARGPRCPAEPMVDVWRAPLWLAALTVTGGMVLDRLVSIPILISLIGALAAILAWIFATREQTPRLALVYLGVSFVGLGAAYHHWYHEIYPADDIGNLAPSRPQLVRVRGVLIDEPTRHGNLAPRDRLDPQSSREEAWSLGRREQARGVLEASSVQLQEAWHPVTGQVALILTEPAAELHAGDEVELAGWLGQPLGAANPGEFDHAGHLRGQRIRAELVVRRLPPDAGWTVVQARHGSWRGWLAGIRRREQEVLVRNLSPAHAPLASALLLGQESGMTAQDWEKFKETGIIHALAISGQHLVILACALGGVLWAVGVRRSRAALVIACFLIGYALLTGARPSVVRAAVMVVAGCVGSALRRPVLSASSFALAWLLVAVLNPADLGTTGCLLSFLAVAVLCWGLPRWFHREVDPLERLEEESRPCWSRWLRQGGRWVRMGYAANAVIWLILAPLMAARSHVVPLAALAIGPPAILLTSVALVSGFLLLTADLVCWPLVPLLAFVTEASLAGCDWLADMGRGLPGGCWYVPDTSEAWLWVFYLPVLGILTLEPLRRRWRWGIPAGLSWVCVGLVGGWGAPAPGDFRCTFLAVGHGGCTVLQTPEGQTLLYDAGALTGPDVTRRQIAPFLWKQGIRRIDEIFLSHADLDHFNGVGPLLDRFAVGQLTCTPTFARRDFALVRQTLEALERRGIPVRVVQAGDELRAGSVALEVLHPPRHGPEGKENARSLVLLVRHAGHAILLTGDLEGAGMDRVLDLPRVPVDVLMAPHHGSRNANGPGLAAWACPRAVVSSQGPARSPRTSQDAYTGMGAEYLTTWEHGATVVISHEDELVVETFRTQRRLVFRKEVP